MNFIIFAILWVIFSLFGEWGANWLIAHYPMVGSVQGKISDDAIFFLLKWSVPIFVFVTLWIVFSVFRFRARSGEEGPAPNQEKDNWRFSWTWFILSAIINIIFIINPGVTGLDALWAHEKTADPLEVDVTAAQWNWTFSYPKYGIKNYDQLILPVDQEDKFVLQTDDVMHSFWVPAFRIKKDVMPGETRTLYMKPTTISQTEKNPLMRVQCSQMCGVGHAEMRALVKVVSREEFNKWVEKNRGKDFTPPGY
ncbi:MAG: cytochrome c oxidase subunit II [Bacillota bacterium]|nr:cytochrome c oxidase subunit II [Bacillota bacterium]